jgi:predicted enzyme related to lactoylglutathione lyase
MSHSGKFIWYELLSTDPQGAEDFYKYVVGWGAKDSGNPSVKYTLLTVDGTHVAGLMATNDACVTGVEAMWSGHILVDDVDETVERVKQAGGKVHFEPMDIPNTGRFAIVADPQGAPFQLFKPSMDDRPNVPTPPTPGTVGWHELNTSDWENAFEFYSGLFGWTKGEAMDMGGMGTYQIVERAGQMFGAMMNNPEPSTRPAWCYYICVDDITAAESRIKDKGGKVVFGPMEVPGEQWVLQALDPQGVSFALLGPRK